MTAIRPAHAQSQSGQTCSRTLTDRGRLRLLHEIENFDIDGGTVVYRFANRLARENSWNLGYTARVIAEYKRFAFLARTAGHMVVPSVAVDKAWHLHLIYTHSYWNRFCRDVLGMELHHHPASKGRDEDAEHVDLYGKTLESYRQALNTEPPADIWPSPNQRFVPKREIWLDVRRYFTLERRFVLPACAALIGIGWSLAMLFHGG